MKMPHLELKRKLRKVGLFGDAFIHATASLPLEMKTTLLIVGRRITVETHQELTVVALRDIEAVSVTQRGMLLNLLEKLLAREGLGWNEGPVYDVWRAEYGAMALELYKQERKA